jgi:hypothetical protein
VRHTDAVKTIAAAIAESTRTGEFARLKLPSAELETAVAAAETAARKAGLEFYRIATPEGCDVFAPPTGEPDTWKLEFVVQGRA